MSLRERASELFWSIAGDAVKAAAIALAFSAWAALEVAALDLGLGWPLAFFAGVVVFGSITMPWVLLVQLHERKQRLTPPSPSDMEDRVRKWLYRAGHSITNVSDRHEGVDFALLTQAAGDPVQVKVLKPSNKRYVYITSVVEILEKHRQVLADKVPLFEEDIIRDLFLLGAQRNLMHDDKERLNRIEVHQHVFFDDRITDYDFLTDHLLVRRGVKLVQNRVQRVLKQRQLEKGGDSVPDTETAEES